MKTAYPIHWVFIIGALFLFGTFGLAGTALAAGQDKPEDETSLEKMLRTQINTASKYAQYFMNIPASVTMITAEDIERFGFRTIDEMMASVPGFYTRYDRDYAFLGTRGLGRPADYNNRILLMLNGNTINDGVYGSAPGGTDYQLDLRIIDRIEIIRGPGSALYGTGAVFAVINIITKRGVDVDGLLVSGEIGSYGRKNAAVIFGKKFKNGLDCLFSGQITDVLGQDLYFPEYDTPETNNGVSRGLDWDKNHGLCGTVEFGDFLVQGALVSRRKGVPTAYYEIHFNDDRAESYDTEGLLEFQYGHDYGIDKNLTVRAYYNKYYDEGRYPYDTLSIDFADSRWYGSEIRFRWDTDVNNRVIIGGEYQRQFRARYKYYDDQSVFVEGEWPYSIYSLYVQDEYQLKKNLSITAGVRRDQYSDIGGRTSPRFGVVYHPFAASAVKLLYGEAFRKPSIYEIYVEDPDSGIKPNLNLKSEEIRTLELSWEQGLKKNLFGFASVYSYRMKNLIDWVLDPIDEHTQAQNIGRIRAWGIELGLQAQLGGEARGHLSYSWQDAKNQDSGSRLTNSPVHLLKGGLILPVLKYFYASALFQYESARLTVYGTRTEPFFLTHLTLTSLRLADHFSLSLQVRNLFDTHYSHPGGPEHIQPALRQNGREVSLRLDFVF